MDNHVLPEARKVSDLYFGLSVKLLLALASTVILDFRSRRDLSPRFSLLGLCFGSRASSSSTTGGVGLTDCQIADGPQQHSDSWFRFLRDSRPHFTV
jgi:hypothetical protein